MMSMMEDKQLQEEFPMLAQVPFTLFLLKQEKARKLHQLLLTS
jgi:hypothetical protein